MVHTAAMVATMVLLAVVPRSDASEHQDALRFTVDRNGAVVVPVRIDGRGPFRSMIDTGSNASFVTPEVVREVGAPIVARADTADRLRLDTLVASREIQAGVVRRLNVGPLALTNQAAALVARDAPDAPEGDGLLPLHRFRTVTFRADERVILIQP